MSDFTHAAKELDQLASQLVKSMARKAVAPLSHNDEAQLVHLSQVMHSITANARNSLLWRCGVVTICGEDPSSLEGIRREKGSLSSASASTEALSRSSSTASNGATNLRRHTSTDAVNQQQQARDDNNNNNITPLDSRVSVIARLTDILSLVFVAHDFFISGSPHQEVFKRAQTVSLLAVVAGACDVPFLPQPLCATAMNALSACLQDYVGVVHSEQSISSNSTANGFACRPPRRFPLSFSLSAQRYLLRNLSRRIFQPLYASWLISALGAPDRLTPFPGATATAVTMTMRNNNNSNRGNNNNVNSDAEDSSSTTMMHSSCFLKDAIIRILCGGFLGDGPAASPHTYVATALNILAMILLVPLEVINEQPQQQSTSSSSSSSVCFDRRAPQIFGAASVEGIAAILEALLRRTATRKDSRRLLQMFWSVRPLVQTLASCPLTKKVFLAAESTKTLFDFAWKSVAGLIDTVDGEREAGRLSVTVFFQQQQQQQQHASAASARSTATTTAAPNSNRQQHQQQQQSPEQSLMFSVLAASMCFLPVGVALWRGIASVQAGPENREFCETVALFGSRVAPLLVPPPATKFTARAGESLRQEHDQTHHLASSHEFILAFDSLVDAVEFAATVEAKAMISGGGSAATAFPQHSSLREWMSHATPNVTAIPVRAARTTDERQLHVQTQWATLLVIIGTEDAVTRCQLATAVAGNTTTSSRHRQQQQRQRQRQQQDSSQFLAPMPPSGGGFVDVDAEEDSDEAAPVHLDFPDLPAMTVMVDTALRDAAVAGDEGQMMNADTVAGCLCACGGSPLAENTPRWLPNAVLRRALLRMSCRSVSTLSTAGAATARNNTNNSISATTMTARDICRVFLRSPEGVTLAWAPVVDVLPDAESERRAIGFTRSSSSLFPETMFTNSNLNNMNNSNKLVLFNNHQDSAARSTGTNNNSNANFGVALAEAEGIANQLRIELAEQKAANFELQRELQKRSSEANTLDARLRALSETISSVEMEAAQHRTAAETTRQMLEQERQSKAQMFHSEATLRQELAQVGARLREYENQRYQATAEAERRANEAERRAAAMQNQLVQAQAELEATRRHLSASEERVAKFVSLQASFAELSRSG